MSDKKNILLVSSAFLPEISPRSFRATELAKELSRQGHHVTVITKYRDHNYSEFLMEYSITLKMWNKPTFPVVPVFKKKPFSILSRLITRLLLILFEYPAIEEMFQVKKMLKNEQGYDLMISFAVPYPVHWGVAASRTLKHNIATTWVADCGDPYMGNHTDSFRKLFYFKYIEKKFCRKADFITIPVESAKSGYYSEFHDKISVIPQGFDFDLEMPEKPDPDNSFPVFAYAGGFIAGIRDPREFMEFLSSLDINFRFIVYTRDRQMIEPFVDQLNGKLEMRDYIPRNELLKKLGSVDFLVNFDNNTDVQVPSKLIDYAIIGRPVLNIKKGFNREDVLLFLKKNYSNRMQIGDIRQYHISGVARQFIQLAKHEVVC